MTENNRIADLYAYLKRTRADEIIVHTTLVAGCWDDNECDAHAAGFLITRFQNPEYIARREFAECYRLTRRASQHRNEIETPTLRVDDGFDLPAFLLGEIYPHMDEEDKDDWNPSMARALAGDLRRHDGIEADCQDIYEIIAEFIRQDAGEGDD